MTRYRFSAITGASALTGMAAGFVGVGGGEFRIPVLVDVLGYPLKLASGINLVIGLFTVALSIGRRWGTLRWTEQDAALVVVMGAASAVGATFGVLGREWLPLRPLKVAVCVYLAAIGLWMLYEAITIGEHALLAPVGVERLVLAAVVSIAIAVISGGLGVAGGELRIPALLYLFAMPIQTAGVISLMVSVPTLAAGALTDRRTGGLSNNALGAAVLMGLASAVGVLVGTALLPYANRDIIKAVLGVVLLVSSLHLAHNQRVTRKALAHADVLAKR